MTQAEAAAVDYDAPCVAAKAQPHEIPLAPESRVVADSAGLGWSDAYASITSRRAWEARIEPLEHLGLVHCLRGENTVERRLDGEPAARTVSFRARQSALLPSQASAWYRVSGDADVLVIYLRGAMLRSVDDRLFGASNRLLHFRPDMSFNDPLLEQICLAFAAALRRRELGRARYMDQLAECAAAHCLTHYRADAATRSAALARPADWETALGRLTGYVDAHLEGDLSVEALAEAARLTPAGLKRALAAIHGTTPRQWIIQRRIAHAERMLAATDLPLAEVALRAGFASQSHLCSMFKREIGRTPGDYRRAQ